MGFCPNCGSWVDEGDVCGVCGGSGSYGYESEEYDDSLSVKINSKKKIRRVMDIFRESVRNNNVDLNQAIRLLDEVIKDTTECLKNDNCDEYFSLRDIKRESIKLKEEIETQIIEIGYDKEYDKIIKNKGKDKLVPIRIYDKHFNPKNLVFKLVKESEKLIRVYHEDKRIGDIYETLGGDWGKLFSTVKELQHLPEISYAKYLCEYPGRYNYSNDSGALTIVELIEPETTDGDVTVNVSEEAPDDFPSWYNKANDLVHQGKYDDAIKCLEEVLFSDPTNTQALQLMGDLYLVGLKDYNQAIKYINVAIKLNPDDSMNWNNLSKAYLNIGEYKKALECCEKARSLDSDNFRAWFTTAEVYYELKQYGKAMEYATKAKELNSTDEDLLNFIDNLKEIISNNSEPIVDPIRKPIDIDEFRELKTQYRVLKYDYYKLKALIIECAENNQSIEELLEIAEEKKLI